MLQILDMNTNPSNVFVFAASIFEILSLFLIKPYFENRSLPDFLLNPKRICPEFCENRENYFCNNLISKL